MWGATVHTKQNFFLFRKVSCAKLILNETPIELHNSDTTNNNSIKEVYYEKKSVNDCSQPNGTQFSGL